ncbi:MAG: ABC transporter transmembrane domain-containing protein, partial [Armatimonadota bacterium]|nr:ABC transporter transmembrane domain-containing protein [Armatimonadota bacterium]
MDAVHRRLPEFVRAAVEQRMGSAKIEFAFASDLSPEGRFGESWLVLADSTLLTLRVDPPLVEVSTSARLPWLRKERSGNGANAAEHTPPRVSIHLVVPLDTVESVRTTQLVGASALEARLKDGRVLELIRYSSALASVFGQVRLRLEALLKNEEPPPFEHKRLACEKCGRPIPEESLSCPACRSQKQVLVRLMGLVRPYWKYMALSTGLAIVSAAVELTPPYLTKVLIDEVLVPRANSHLFFWLLGALIAVRLLGMGIHIARGRLNAWLGSEISFMLRSKLFQHLQWLSLSYFDKRQTGSIMSRVTRDTEALYDFVVNSAPTIALNLLMIIGIATVMVWMDWKLSLLVLIPAPFIVWLSRY